MREEDQLEQLKEEHQPISPEGKEQKYTMAELFADYDGELFTSEVHLFPPIGAEKW